MLSTRHQWFPFGPLSVSHLIWFFPDLFLPRSRPWLLTTAAGGGLKPAPASRFRGAAPHQSSSYTLRALLGPLRSWRTVVGIPHQFGVGPLGWSIGSMKQLVEPVQVDVRKQGRYHPALRRSLFRAAPLVRFATVPARLHDWGFQPHPDQLQYAPVHHSHPQTSHQLVVRNRIEVPFQVRVVHGLIARFEMSADLLQRLMRRAVGTEPVGAILEISFKDRFQ